MRRCQVKFIPKYDCFRRSRAQPMVLDLEAQGIEHERSSNTRSRTRRTPL